MKNSIKIICGLLIAGIIGAGCEKKVDPVEKGYSVSVTFNQSGAHYLDSDVQVNPKDSIFLDFTITASEDMEVVEIQKNGAKIDTFNVPAGSKRNFSGIKKYMSDSIAGDYTYRILARNNKGIFIGDGNKSIKVTVNADFYLWSYRFLYVPDTVQKKNNCYFASSTGETFSYSDGASKSALIDFAYYYDTTTANKHTIYALNASQTQLSFYDISSWTKNATIFKRSSSPSFSTLTSGGALRTAGISNLASGTSSRITVLAAGNTIYFKTITGKYGCILISFIEGTSEERSTHINVDVKIQK